MRKRSCLVLSLALLAILAFSVPVSADSVNVIKNGSFEDEFVYGVGKYWGAFNNGGYASYGYDDDTWAKVVKDGQHSQLIEIHTKAVGGSHPNRYVGIYQTADVVPGKRYMLSFYGMVRSTEGTEWASRWNYRVQVGYDYNGGSDWQAVTDWVEMTWPEHDRLHPGPIQSYAHGVTATGDKLTLFIRVWKKFPTVGEEGNINIDAVSLIGPAPSAAAEPVAEGEQPTIPKTGAGLALPLAGVALAMVALTLTGRRLLRHN